MKILHLTDIHIAARYEPGTLDRSHRLKRCIENINQHHSDAALCIITGDLADDGAIISYEILHDLLGVLKVPVKLALGNHDDRDNFKKVFTSAEIDQNGFVQTAFNLDGKRIIILDTVLDGKIYGSLCKKRMDWLKEELKASRDRDVLIFMHHPPFPIGLRHHERIGLIESDEFVSLCSNAGNVRRIFAGHVHADANVRKQSLYVSLSRGVSQHLLFDEHNVNASYIDHTPAFNIILSNAFGESVHFYDLMHETEIMGQSQLSPAQEWNGTVTV